MPSNSPASRIPELFRFFSRLGVTAFGGPAAHIALMEHEAVEQRGWLSREHFLDLVGACNLLPGPSSTQVAMALGYVRGGWAGLAVAGGCFILPASLATLALAWVYVHYGRLPAVQGVLYGAKAVMLAIIVQAIWRLGRTALRRWLPALAGALCLAAALLGAPPFAVLVASGVALALLAAARRWSKNRTSGVAPFALLAISAPPSTGLASIALVFLKLGIVVFGSGYVLLAFLQADLVDRLHWINSQQLLDAITAGQVTPGPVFATATFLGYLIHGYSGAVVATVAIFLPSFVLAGIVGALAGHMRKSPLAAAFLDGVNAAAISLMVMITLTLARSTLIDAFTWAIALSSAVLLLRFRVNATWLLLSGAVLGIVMRGMHFQ